MKRLKLSFFIIGMILLLASCGKEEDKTANDENLTEQQEEVSGNESEREEEQSVAVEEEQKEELQIKPGEVMFLNIPSPSLENSMVAPMKEQEIAVYVPVGYDTEGKEYPVLYFLPGFDDGVNIYIHMFSKIIDQVDINDMIIVVVNGKNLYDGSFYANSPVTGNWEDYVAQDVVTYMDENFKTIKSSDGRGIAGHSMGGTGALNIVLHTKDIFGNVYAMSPGLFDADGLKECDVDFSVLEEKLNEYENLTEEEALTAIQKENFSWPVNFSIGYASAFAYNEDTKSPYIDIPQKDENGEYMQDETWNRYESGFGNLEEKLDEYGDNLKSLNHLCIDYGTTDKYQWIPKGCEYFSELLEEREIPHELVPFEGGHSNMTVTRAQEVVIPFFSEAFGQK